MFMSGHCPLLYLAGLSVTTFLVMSSMGVSFTTGDTVTVLKGENATLPCGVNITELVPSRFYDAAFEVFWRNLTMSIIFECSGYMLFEYALYIDIGSDINCQGKDTYSSSIIRIHRNRIFGGVIDFDLYITNTTIRDEGEYDCNFKVYNYFTDLNSTTTISSELIVVIPPDVGYPVCSVNSVGQSIDMTGNTMKTAVHCESEGGRHSVTLKLVSDSNEVVAMRSGLENEKTLVTFEFMSNIEDAGKVFTCHVIQGGIETAACSTGPTTILTVYTSMEQKKSGILLFICYSNEQIYETQFAWYINETNIKSSVSGIFGALSHGNILTINQSSMATSDTNLLIRCGATTNDGIGSSEVTIHSAEMLNLTQLPPPLPAKAYDSDGGAVAGAFFGGVFLTLFCLSVIVAVYLMHAGKLRKTLESLCGKTEGQDKYAERSSRKNSEGRHGNEKETTRYHPDNNRPISRDNVAIDDAEYMTADQPEYTALQGDKLEPKYEGLSHENMAISEDTYEIF